MSNGREELNGLLKSCIPEEILNEASELGWLPQEKWKGALIS